MKLNLYFEFPADDELNNSEKDAEDATWERLSETGLFSPDPFIEPGGECTLEVDSENAAQVEDLILAAFPRAKFICTEVAD
jgi:hypothetical protein